MSDPSEPTSAGPPQDPDLTEALRLGASSGVTPSRRPVRAPSFPSGSRFEQVAFLGQGGMGQVFKAFDPRLRRTVAIKLALGDHPETLERFTREAQAQARVDHPFVAKVFEVGEIGGRPYFAMQFIEGRSLEELSKELGWDEKARLMKQVAEGVHAAHRIGLLHRDLKPANIMVERQPDGRLHPFVMDFGLVRELGSAGMTQAGFAMGTPAYMSPEQVRGLAASLDVRTDVYCLGASLYELLAGQSVFGAHSSLEVIRLVLEEEPRPLRELVPDLPEDLAIIVHKCLEKEPDRRYDGALALAEDLQRFLDGRPILARPASRAYRMSKWLRRNRTLAAMGGVSALALLLVSGLALRTVLRTRRQAVLTAQFIQEVQGIEDHLRMAHLAPPHDLRPQVAWVRARMDGIRGDMGRAGSLGLGPGAYALGRGHLELNEVGDARAELDRAWEAGYRTTEVAAARGEAFMRIFYAGVEDLDKVQDAELRKRRRAELEKTYQEPAVALLGQAQGEAAEQRFQKAEVAYLGWNDEAALEACRQVLMESPWRYEAWQLQFRVWKRRADRLASQGDLPGRDAAIRAADEAMAQTLSVARCDPQVLVEQADWVLEKTGLGMKTEAPRLLEETLAICDRALAIDPSNLRALQRRSEAHWRTSSDMRDSGQDFTEHMKLAIADGETAVRLVPKDGRARLVLGRALLLKVQQQLLRGGTDVEALARASEELDAAQRLAASDDVALPMTLSYARYLQAEDARQRGQDPRGFFKQAVEASEAFSRMSPNDPSACGGLGELLKESAMAERRAGADPTPLLQRSQASFEREVAVAPGSAQLLKDLGSVHRLLAQAAVDRRQDPGAELRLAAGLLDKAEALRPKFAEIHQERGASALVAARWSELQGGDPSTELKEARSRFQLARTYNAQEAELAESLAETAWLQARWEAGQRRNPAARVAEGLAAAATALKLNPKQHRARALAGALRLVRAQGGAKAEAQAACEDLDAALRLDPFLSHEFTPWRDQAKALAAR